MQWKSCAAWGMNRGQPLGLTSVDRNLGETVDLILHDETAVSNKLIKSKEMDMNAHQKKAARFTATAFGVIILAISASTSFAFFYNYFSNLIPPGVLGPDVAALISGIVGTLLFDVAAVVWLQTYLNDARTPEQRAISLMMLIVTFVGAAAASVAHLSLSATGDLALDAATLDSIATVSLVTVIIGVIANFGSTIAYQRFSYDNKQSVRTSDREDEIQKAEDEAANELDSLVSQKLKEKLTHIAPSLADQQAARIAAQYARRESAKYGSAEVESKAGNQWTISFLNSKAEPWWFTVVGNLDSAIREAKRLRNEGSSDVAISDQESRIVWPTHEDGSAGNWYVFSGDKPFRGPMSKSEAQRVADETNRTKGSTGYGIRNGLGRIYDRERGLFEEGPRSTRPTVSLNGKNYHPG